MTANTDTDDDFESMAPPMQPNETWLNDVKNGVVEIDFPNGSTYRVTVNEVHDE